MEANVSHNFPNAKVRHASELPRSYRAPVVSIMSATRFRLEACPRTGRESTQQLAVESGVQSKTFGNGKDDLTMCDGKADCFRYVDRG